MKKTIILFLIVFGMSSMSNAQDYNTGIGLRGGLYNGLTIKHFIGSNTAVEGILTSRWKGYKLTALYEKEYHVFDAERLNWYFGVGAHMGFWNGDYVSWGDPGSKYTVVGLDVILGLEYNFRVIPFNISLDWKPEYNFVGYSGVWVDGGAMSIRYIF